MIRTCRQSVDQQVKHWSKAVQKTSSLESKPGGVDARLHLKMCFVLQVEIKARSGEDSDREQIRLPSIKRIHIEARAIARATVEAESISQGPSLLTSRISSSDSYDFPFSFPWLRSRPLSTRWTICFVHHKKYPQAWRDWRNWPSCLHW